MKDHEIYTLAARFGLVALLTSEHHKRRFFDFVREVEKQVKEKEAAKRHE